MSDLGVTVTSEQVVHPTAGRVIILSLMLLGAVRIFAIKPSRKGAFWAGLAIVGSSILSAPFLFAWLMFAASVSKKNIPFPTATAVFASFCLFPAMFLIWAGMGTIYQSLIWAGKRAFCRLFSGKE